MRPKSSHDELQTGPMSWLWCLLFGPIYFLMTGRWRHALASFLVTIVTGVLSSWLYALLAAWLLYPLVVEAVNASTRPREGRSAATNDSEGSRRFFPSAAENDPEDSVDDRIDAMIARQKVRLEREQAKRNESEATQAVIRSQTSERPRGFGKRRSI
jgi:Protein of unknown function (DUF2628)